MENRETIIKLNTISDVQNLCNLAAKNEGDVLLISGKFVINAKSFQGIISLDLSNPIKLEAEAPINNEFAEGIKKFIV